MQINDYLAECKVEFERLLHPPAYSAQMRAKTLHVPGKEVAKTVLLEGKEGYLIAILPATRRIDTERLGFLLDQPLRVASSNEVAAVFDNCEWGVVSPFGRLYGLPTLLDDCISSEAMLVFEGSTHVEAIRVRCRDFEMLEKPRRLPCSSSE